MALEIEHKFLLKNENWKQYVNHSTYYIQGYLPTEANCSIRVRISDQAAWLNIKSATIGSHRSEYEYEIPLAEAEEIISQLCRKPLIEKMRHFIEIGPHTWEIDEFMGENAGLVIAEIELSEIGEQFAKPDWLGLEVTDDYRFYNNNLAKNPYSTWKK